MKLKKISLMLYLFWGIAIIACQSSKKPEFIPSPHFVLFTVGPPSPTPTFRPPDITPWITATPIVANIKNSSDLKYIIEDQIYFYYPCITMNFAEAPQDSTSGLSEPTFTQVEVELDQKKHWIEEIAYNVSNTRRAWIAFDNPDNAIEHVFVEDISLGIVYDVDWHSANPARPVQWLQWINNDILTFSQDNFATLSISAINVAEKKLVYYSLVFPNDVCVTSTPTVQ